MGMKSSISTWLGTAGLVVVLAAAGAWFYTGPTRALADIHVALTDRDLQALEARVDFPAVREQVKATIAAELAESAAGSPGEQMGAMLGMALVGSMIDSFLTPQGLMAMVASGASPQAESAARASGEWQQWMKKGKVSTRFTSLSKAEVALTHESNPTEVLVVVLELQGTTWRVVGGRMDDVSQP